MTLNCDARCSCLFIGLPGIARATVTKVKSLQSYGPVPKGLPVCTTMTRARHFLFPRSVSLLFFTDSVKRSYHRFSAVVHVVFTQHPCDQPIEPNHLACVRHWSYPEKSSYTTILNCHLFSGLSKNDSSLLTDLINDSS